MLRCTNCTTAAQYETVRDFSLRRSEGWDFEPNYDVAWFPLLKLPDSVKQRIAKS